ncbi:MAG: hypothetical protein KDC44_05215 [Phaeodactylibacter sp.]|nr:hypothetical protein [Phaeodactylibacter sp.]
MLNFSRRGFGYFYILLAAGLFLTGCMGEEKVFIPDVSDLEVQVEVRRFEQDLFSLDTNQLETALPALQAQYGEFAELFFGQILGSTDPRIAPMGHLPYVRGFLTHPFVQKLADTCQIVYGDFSAQQAEFEQAFKFLKYYFPNVPTPDITTFVSEFSIANFIYGRESLAVGLDFFLGKDYPYQRYNPNNPNFSDYLVRSNTPDHLVSKTLVPLVNDLLGEVEGNRLLDYMVHNGKRLYILDQLLPYASDTVIIEYTADQLAWCQENEFEMWAYFLEEDMLYSSRFQDFRKMIEHSPHSPGMPPEAPGRTANWLGWQMIKAFMKRNPEVSLPELIAIQDAQEILDRSKYRPN